MKPKNILAMTTAVIEMEKESCYERRDGAYIYAGNKKACVRIAAGAWVEMAAHRDALPELSGNAAGVLPRLFDHALTPGITEPEEWPNPSRHYQPVEICGVLIADRYVDFFRRWGFRQCEGIYAENTMGIAGKATAVRAYHKSGSEVQIVVMGMTR